MTNPIRFGTDGWRALIAEDFTFDNVRACARGVAGYLEQAGLSGHGLIIGYDTRFASREFAAAAAEVVAGCGIDVWLCPHATPTPIISYGVVAENAGGAVIITASHNPGAWNGFKFKNEHGSSASDDVTATIEAFTTDALCAGNIARLPLERALAEGKVRYHDLDDAYFTQIEKLVELEPIRQAGLNLAVDSMYGAGAGYLGRLLTGGKTEILEIHGEPNPNFPGLRPEPIPPNLDGLSKQVLKISADAGLATDGDADRMGIVDENGQFVTQLVTFALLCQYLLEVRGERGGLVKTVNETAMTEKLGQLYGVPVYETPVGFKNVAPAMAEHGAIIGGEESGGYGFAGHVLERDGILASLYLLDYMVKTGKTISQLIEHLYARVGPHHYLRTDIEFPADERAAILERVRGSRPDKLAEMAVDNTDTKDGFRFFLAGGGWLLIRFSGTEPLLRIYAESQTPERAQKLLDAGRGLAGV